MSDLGALTSLVTVETDNLAQRNRQSIVPVDTERKGNMCRLGKRKRELLQFKSVYMSSKEELDHLFILATSFPGHSLPECH